MNLKYTSLSRSSGLGKMWQDLNSRV